MIKWAKPPIGVIPTKIWEHERMVDLSRAINEYIKYGDLKPVEGWINELTYLYNKQR